MRYGKGFIGLFTAVLLLTAVFFGKYEYSWHGDIGITAQISTPSGTETITCWEQYEKNVYLFLPSYGEHSQITLQSNTTAEVFLTGLPLDEVVVKDLPEGVPLQLDYHWKGRVYPYNLILMRSENLPALYIDTISGSMDTIHGKKGNSESGDLRLYTQMGDLNYAGQLDMVRGRGNSTWNEEKKPYNLTLAGQGDLLGMGTAKKWILLANAKDSSHIRNKLVYDFAADVGMPHTPESQWVDLYLNGEYAGLYLLCERNEVAENRVDISQEDSFLVTKDWAWRFEDEGHPFFLLDSEAALCIRYSGMEQAALQSIWQRAENAILAEDGIDPASGKHWTELLDLDSWARKFLIEEVFANEDAPALSQNFYYDGTVSDKIYAGPVWDYDLIAGAGEGNVLCVTRTDVYASPWYGALYQKSSFHDRVTELYKTEFLPLLRQYLEENLPSYMKKIHKAAAMDQIRWETASMEHSGPQLIQTLNRRLDFLTSLWIEKNPYIYVDVNIEQSVSRYAVHPGDTLDFLPSHSDTPQRTYLGWFDLTTGQKVDVTQPLYADAQLELRFEEHIVPVQEEPLPLTSFVWAGALCFLFAAVWLVDAGQRHKEKSRETVSV